MDVNGIAVQTLQDYKKLYDKRFPEKQPVQKVATFKRVSFKFIELSRRAIVLWLIVLCANIMSAGHIVPAMNDFYTIETGILTGIMGFSGFVAMSFAVITFMSREKRGPWAWLVISTALLAETAINVFTSLKAIESSEAIMATIPFLESFPLNVTAMTAIIVGLLPGIVNMATGEQIRQDNIEEAREKADTDKANAQALRQYQVGLERYYISYLKRQGIRDETTIQKVLLGEYDDVDEAPPPVPHQDFADILIKDGTQGMTYKELSEKYNVSHTTIRDAKEKLGLVTRRSANG